MLNPEQLRLELCFPNTTSAWTTQDIPSEGSTSQLTMGTGGESRGVHLSCLPAGRASLHPAKDARSLRKGGWRGGGMDLKRRRGMESHKSARKSQFALGSGQSPGGASALRLGVRSVLPSQRHPQNTPQRPL